MERKVAIIVGPGRSGTSVLVAILLNLGMRGSRRFIESNDSNPEGFYEDEDIVCIHKELYSEMGLSAHKPVRDEFFENKNLNRFGAKLRSIVELNIEKMGSVWGFKDPRVSVLIPFWISKVLNPLHATPKFILSVRNPMAVVNSMGKEKIASNVAEMIWLVRTCDALYYSKANCFIVNYEDWFTKRACDLAINLAAYLDLDAPGEKLDINGMLDNVVKKSLNRSSYEKYKVKNPLVNKLYEKIKDCHGDEFDRDGLMATVIECRQVIQSFIFDESADNKSLAILANEQLKEIIDLKQNVKELTAKSQALNFKKDLLEKESKSYANQLENCKASFKYRIGQTFEKATKKPRKNIIVFPFCLFKVIVKEVLSRWLR